MMPLYYRGTVPRGDHVFVSADGKTVVTYATPDLAREAAKRTGRELIELPDFPHEEAHKEDHEETERA